MQTFSFCPILAPPMDKSSSDAVLKIFAGMCTVGNACIYFWSEWKKDWMDGS